ncbi:MAG TPA: helicase-related protein [Labilithrix sp.]|nr:helicase-related protein [Labilithrix sp.]
MFAPGITALLGPTNTGKTFHAIERMLEHPSGMIGLPLRLLAREVYDRITARVGESRVALVTGEEQRIPRRPSYWVATVEAMPVERDVDFLAVDEIQLAAHAQRGHVFTSRLLSARGRVETWFLGADTMRGALRELVPTARHVEHPRLSRLTYAGAVPLARLPPRSAVVAFSMPHVYELADRLRKRRGGAAVVLGALSPRTRNAQVAMFQAGEVDCLVATDAIGMGLNLDVEHVAFAATRKFDGRDVRDVDDAELAQIAGRAGRWIHDGTFGALTPLELPFSTAHAIENHSHSPVRRVQWRSDDLDFSSVTALRTSLAEPPTRGILRHAAGAEDAACLALLAGREEIVARATDADSVRLLWDVCTVPDFRKLMLEVHVDFLEQLFVEVADRGRIRDEWIERQLHDLERGSSGASHDVEELVARIAAVRTWTYVANRSTWLESADGWQQRTRDLEDRLSDALHERLVLRFVDAKKAARPRARPAATNAQRESEPNVGQLATDPSHPFAKLASFRAAVPGAAAKHARPGSPAWVEEIVEAEHAAFSLAAGGDVVHSASGRIVGRIVRGGSIALPDVRLADGEIGAGARSRLQRRLLAFARDAVADLLGGIGDLATRDASAPLRAFIHRLEQGLGTALAADLDDVLAVLGPDDRTALEDSGVRFGAGVVYLPVGLEARSIEARSALATAWFRAGRALLPPAGGAVSFVPSRGVDRRAWTAIGFPVLGPRAIRVDVLDRVLERIRTSSDDDPADEATLATWIGTPRGELKKVLASVGLEQRSADG